MAKKAKKQQKISKQFKKPNSFVVALKTSNPNHYWIFFHFCFFYASLISFFFNWQEDQNILGELSNKSIASRNLLGKIGAALGDFLSTGVWN